MGRAKADYATLSIDKVMALPVADLADTDCHLYLWITASAVALASLCRGEGYSISIGERFRSPLPRIPSGARPR